MRDISTLLDLDDCGERSETVTRFRGLHNTALGMMTWVLYLGKGGAVRAVSIRLP